MDENTNIRTILYLALKGNNSYFMLKGLRKKDPKRAYILAQIIKNKTNEKYIENITGLDIKHVREWLIFTKKFYIPNDYKGAIDIEHEYPLSTNDINKSMKWSHLRYMISEQNRKKYNKPPTPLDKLKQMMVAYIFYRTSLYSGGAEGIVL